MVYTQGCTYAWLAKKETIQNVIREGIKKRLSSGHVRNRTAQNLPFSCLESKKVKIRNYRTTILPVVLYCSETCSPPLREELNLNGGGGEEDCIDLWWKS